MSMSNLTSSTKHRYQELHPGSSRKPFSSTARSIEGGEERDRRVRKVGQKGEGQRQILGGGAMGGQNMGG